MHWDEGKKHITSASFYTTFIKRANDFFNWQKKNKCEFQQASRKYSKICSEENCVWETTLLPCLSIPKVNKTILEKKKKEH